MNPLEMMKNVKQMQERIQAAQERIKTFKTEGSSGGGMVKLSLDCTMRITKVFVDPSMANPEDFVMIGDLLIAAYNEAHGKMTMLIQDEMRSASGGLPIPDIFGSGVPGL